MDHTHTNLYNKRVKDQREIFLPEVWGPHYWFFLMTVALTYPDHATAVSRRKYYDLIQNMPIFIPNSEISKNFSELLNHYPVTPYLDNRDSFVHWVVFIHNKVNEQLGKRVITIDEAMDQYFRQMVPPTIFHANNKEVRKYAVYTSIIVLLAIVVYFLYKL
jgi:hypothetical protein